MMDAKREPISANQKLPEKQRLPGSFYCQRRLYLLYGWSCVGWAEDFDQVDLEYEGDVRTDFGW